MAQTIQSDSLILSIETSCDDTSVAIVRPDGFVRSCMMASEDQDHARFGGIVPEIASRNHTHHLLPMIDRVLSEAKLRLADLSGVAVTSKPGLIGSLLTGLVTAKTLSLASELPWVGVNHLEGHLLAGFLWDQHRAQADLQYPFLALAVSGGHSTLYRVDAFGCYKVLGATRDDAAGEAFDKFAKRIGLGFPGGARVDRMAFQGDPRAFQFPRGLDHDKTTLDLSFSGLKTAAARVIDGLSTAQKAQMQNEVERFAASGFRDSTPGIAADLCASFQESVCESLVNRMDRAAEIQLNSTAEPIQHWVLTGGVAANSRLRFLAQKSADRLGLHLIVPPNRYCTDNAAMIGYVGAVRLMRGERSPMDLAPLARAPLVNESNVGAVSSVSDR